MSCPSTNTRPALGVTIPQMMLIKVVLPAPFGPSRAKISPLRMSRSTCFSASKPDAYVFDRFLTEMIGCMGEAGSFGVGRIARFNRRCQCGDSTAPGGSFVVGAAFQFEEGDDARLDDARMQGE